MEEMIIAREKMPIDCEIKIKNYKCFGENQQGFNCICPINIIIGRNNSGKSSLIDLIQYVIDSNNALFRLGHLGNTPEVFITQPLTENELKYVWELNSSGRENSDDHPSWQNRITCKLTKDGRVFHSLEKPFPLNPEVYEKELMKDLEFPFGTKLFRRISSERDIVREKDSDRPPQLESNGEGATNLIQNFLNKTIYPRDLVRKEILVELNTIVKPDLSFSDIVIRQDSENNFWEIYLEDDKKGIIGILFKLNGKKKNIIYGIFGNISFFL